MIKPATSVNIVAKQPDHDESVIALRAKIYPHLAPVSLDLFRHWQAMDHIHPQSLVERYSVFDGEALVGSATVERSWGLEKPGAYSTDIRVDPAVRSQGIGGQIDTFVNERLTHHGANRVYAGVLDNDEYSLGFATRRGYASTGHVDRASKLAVSEASWEGYEGLTERLAEAGITIRRLDELTGASITAQPSEMEAEDLMHKLHALFEEAITDIPGPETFSGMPFDVFLKEMDGPPGHPNLFWIALRGDEPVGIATLMYRDDRNYYTGLTGTARSARGLGVARGVKQAAIQWAQSAGIEHLYTDNDVHNTRMLAINVRLGFKPIPSTIQLVKDLAENSSHPA